MSDMRTEHALAIVRGQLRRVPADALEAAVVLEASAGIAPDRALDLGRATVKAARHGSRDRGLLPSVTQLMATAKDETVTARLVALLAFIALLASLGAGAITAWRAAMVVGFALQGLLFRRYVTGQDRLGIVRRDPMGALGVVVVAAACATVLAGDHLLAAALLAIWIGGIAIAERGWVRVYIALAAVLAAARLSHEVSLTNVAIAGVIATAALVVAAVLTTTPSDLRSCSWSRAFFSSIVASGFGLLIWLLPTTWTNLSPRVAAVPLVLALVGSTWAASHLNGLWHFAPRVFSETELNENAADTARGVVHEVFGGAAVRLCGTWVAALIVILGLTVFASLRPGVTDALELMMLLFAITTLAVETALLDTFQHPAAALIAVLVAVGTTVALTPIGSRTVVIAIGTIVGIVFASTLLARQLRRAPLLFVTHLV